MNLQLAAFSASPRFTSRWKGPSKSDFLGWQDTDRNAWDGLEPRKDLLTSARLWRNHVNSNFGYRDAGALAIFRDCTDRNLVNSTKCASWHFSTIARSSLPMSVKRTTGGLPGPSLRLQLPDSPLHGRDGDRFSHGDFSLLVNGKHAFISAPYRAL